MYAYIIGIIVIVIVLFLIYKFYPKINTLIKKYIISFQYVKQIKQQMKDLDEPIIEKKENPPQITKTINEILYLPVDFLYKLIITYGTPIFYTISRL